MRVSKIAVLIVIGLLAGALLRGRSSAQDRPTAPAMVKVGVCDVVEVFNNYTRADDLTATLNKRRDALKAENEKRGQAIEALRLELDGLIMGSKKYEAQFSEMQRLTIERDAWMRFQEAMVMRDHHRLTRDMYDEIIKTIGEVAKQRGFHVVLHRPRADVQSKNTRELLQQIQARQVLYAADSVDLTDVVLMKLNEDYRARSK